MRDEYWSQGIERDVGDARTEAERIVGDYARFVRSAEREPRLDGAMYEHGDALVAALAAAITTVEHYTNGSAYMEQVLDEQTDALSALRARAGEGA